MREVAVDGNRTVSILREPADEENYSMEYEVTHAAEAQRLTDEQAFNYPVAADDEKYHNPASMRRVMRLTREVVAAYPTMVPASQVRVHERASVLRRPEVRELILRTCLEEYAAANGVGLAEVPAFQDLPEFHTFPFLRTLAGIILTGLDDEVISDLINSGDKFNYDTKFRCWKGVPQIGFTARVNKAMAVILSLSTAKKDGVQQIIELLGIPGGATPDAILQDLSHLKSIASGISAWTTIPTLNLPKKAILTIANAVPVSVLLALVFWGHHKGATDLAALKIWADANATSADIATVESTKTIWTVLLAGARAASMAPANRIDLLPLHFSRTAMVCPPAKQGESHADKRRIRKTGNNTHPAPTTTAGSGSAKTGAGKKGDGKKGSKGGKGKGDGPRPAHYCAVPHDRVKAMLKEKYSLTEEQYYEKMRRGACAYHVGQKAGLMDGNNRVFCPHGDRCPREHSGEITRGSVANFLGSAAESGPAPVQ